MTSDLFNILQESLIQTNNCVGISMEDARAISGRFESLQVHAKQKLLVYLSTSMIH